MVAIFHNQYFSRVKLSASASSKFYKNFSDFELSIVCKSFGWSTLPEKHCGLTVTCVTDQQEKWPYLRGLENPLVAAKYICVKEERAACVGSPDP